jgi:hypothetical protein
MEVLKGKRHYDATDKKSMAAAKQSRVNENQRLKCCGE